MKRFTFTSTGMVENSTGAWVQAEAAEREVERLRKALSESCSDMRSEWLGQCPSALDAERKLAKVLERLDVFPEVVTNNEDAWTYLQAIIKEARDE